MKNLRSLLLSLGALLLVLQLAFVSPINAQSSKELERERINQIMQPTADIEAFRQEYLNYLTEFEDTMRLFNEIPVVREKLTQSGLKPMSVLGEAKRSLAELPTEDLIKMRAAYAKFPGWREMPQSLIRPEVRQKLEARLAPKKTGGMSMDAGTTDDCDFAREQGFTNTDISIAKAVLIAAQAAADVIPPVANALAVAAVATADAAVLYIETNKAIADDCNGNDFEAGITQQVTNSTSSIISNDNSNTTSIITNAAANTTTITGAVTAATNTIVSNDNTNKTAIITNDNTNTTNIINNDNANKTAIINNDNANTLTIKNAVEAAKTQVIINANANKDELLRLQIHADLATADSATPVAIFVLPATKNGYLELARTIVVQMITDLAGSRTAEANAFLAQGDTFKNAGNYKSAYSSYRKAYQTAAR